MKPEKKLVERTLSGFLWMITGSGIQVGLKIGVLAVLARFISPKEFGVVGMAVIAVDFSKLFSHMGVGPAIVQRKELEDRHLTTGLTLSIMMGLFFAGLLNLLSPLLAEFFRMPGLELLLRFVSLIFLVDSLTLVGQALMQRNMNFKTIAAIEVASYGIGYGAVGMVLAYLGWGMWALAAALLSQAVLHALLVVIIQPFPKKPGFEKAAFKELISFGGGMTLARLGNFLAVQGDNLVIGRMLGAGALGIYGRAYQFMVMPASLFGNALDKSLFPAMAKVQDDKERLSKAYLTGVSSIALAAIPLSAIFVFLAPEIVMLLLGPKWTSVILPFQILACSLLFRMSYKMSDSLARAKGAVYRRAWRQFLYALFVVLGSYAGQFWGLPGVAVGVAIALAANFLMMAHLSIQLTNTTWTDILKAHYSGLNLGLVTGTITYALVTLTRSYFGPGFLTLSLTVLGLSLISALVVWRFPKLFIRDEQKELLQKLLLKKFNKTPESKPMEQIISKPVATLPLIQNLLAAWHNNNIIYCHWKSNEHLAASMTGDTDLDVLFDENQKEKTIEILHAMGFKRFHSISQKEYKDIEDFLGLDLESGKVIHVHAHFRLTMGEMYLKGYQLNFEDKILNTRYFNETYGIFCSSPAFELVLLYIREALKLRHRDQGLMYFFNKLHYTGNTQVEYEWLRKQVNNSDMEAILKSIFRNYAPIYQYICGPFNRRELFKLAGLLREEFRDNRIHSPGMALVMRWYREITVKASRKLARLLNQPILAQRINPRGGMVVAVIGADGSGKSTVTANLQATFRQKLDVYRIYFGRGDGRISVSRKILQLLKKSSTQKVKQADKKEPNGMVSDKKSGLLGNTYKCLEALLVAREKSLNLQRMLEARAKGMLVICDRFPQNQIMGYNDGPMLHHLTNSKNPVFRAIAKYEAKVYARAENTPPDAMIKLIADAKVVEARKPGETSIDKLETKIAGIKKLQFRESCKTITIDATQPLHQVLTTVKQSIWQNCP